MIFPDVNDVTNIVTVSPSEAQLNEFNNSFQLWHERLRHLNKQHVKIFIYCQSIKVHNDTEFCEAFVLGKQHRNFHFKIGNKVQRIW